MCNDWMYLNAKPNRIRLQLCFKYRPNSLKNGAELTNLLADSVLSMGATKARSSQKFLRDLRAFVVSFLCCWNRWCGCGVLSVTISQGFEVDVNEAEQIVAARGGNEATWAALVQAHQAAVFRLAYLLLGDADEAEDVAQEAFIRAFYALARFDPARPLRPWLLQIARNLAYNRRRSLRRYLAALGRWWEATSSQVEAPSVTVLQEQEAQTLWQAVQQLQVRDQEVIYVRYFLALSVADTAAALGVAEGTVKSRLSRALSRLRTVVEREFPGLQKEGVV